MFLLIEGGGGKPKIKYFTPPPPIGGRNTHFYASILLVLTKVYPDSITKKTDRIRIFTLLYF